MGACLSKTTVAPWPELPPEITGLIFCRLPSHDDRLSFGPVCRRWRIAARQQSPLPPAMPCINLGNGTYQSLIDGKVRRFPTPKGYHAGSSFDGWLLYYNEGSGRCFLGAPFSGAAIEVPTRYHRVLIGRDIDIKLVVCSSGLVIIRFRHPRIHDDRLVSYLAVFRPVQQLEHKSLVCSSLVQTERYRGWVGNYTDIAIYRGKIFALSSHGQLFCHDVDGETKNQGEQPIINHANGAHPTRLTNCYYLVVSFDQENLLMVRFRRSVTADGRRAMDVQVFKADFEQRRWLEVKDLGEQVLFLGRNCSMAFAAGSMEHWGRKFRGGNRVFVLGTEWAQSLGQPISHERMDVPSYCVYDMMSGETSFVSLDKEPRYMESHTSGWFFPH